MTRKRVFKPGDKFLLSTYISAETYDMLYQLADRMGVSVSAYSRAVLNEHIKTHKDKLRVIRVPSAIRSDQRGKAA